VKAAWTRRCLFVASAALALSLPANALANATTAPVTTTTLGQTLVKPPAASNDLRQRMIYLLQGMATGRNDIALKAYLPVSAYVVIKNRAAATSPTGTTASSLTTSPIWLRSEPSFNALWLLATCPPPISPRPN
jgi:hypothetical protein